MDTYGDLVTLLLCFFVLLFSFSSVNAEKWETLLGALSGSPTMVIPILDVDKAMERPISLIVTTTDEDEYEDGYYNGGYTQDEIEQMEKEQNNFLLLYENIKDYVDEYDMTVELSVDYETYVITVRFVENVLFSSGSAKLLDESNPILNQMINVLATNQEYISMIRIEGHTDNRAIHTSQFEDNWDLSTKRATNVLRYMLNSGRIFDRKISSVGYGEYHPVQPNDTEEGRGANRRVDFVIEGYRTR